MSYEAARLEIQVAADIILGNARLLAPGRYRWARALGWMCVVAILCVLSFNLAADAILRIAAALSGQEFTGRASAPTTARLAAVVVGSAAMLIAYRIAVRLGERCNRGAALPLRLQDLPSVLLGPSVIGIR